MSSHYSAINEHGANPTNYATVADMGSALGHNAIDGQVGPLRKKYHGTPLKTPALTMNHLNHTLTGRTFNQQQLPVNNGKMNLNQSYNGLFLGGNVRKQTFNGNSDQKHNEIISLEHKLKLITDRLEMLKRSD
jgi:hypothetical protein